MSNLKKVICVSFFLMLTFSVFTLENLAVSKEVNSSVTDEIEVTPMYAFNPYNPDEIYIPQPKPKPKPKPEPEPEPEPDNGNSGGGDTGGGGSKHDEFNDNAPPKRPRK